MTQEQDIIARLERAEALLSQLALRWMPAVRTKLQALEASLPRRRNNKSNWRDHVTVNAMCDGGLSVRKASLRLGLPYTTCHRYRFLDERVAEKLREKWEADNPPFGPDDVDPALLTG